MNKDHHIVITGQCRDDFTYTLNTDNLYIKPRPFTRWEKIKLLFGFSVQRVTWDEGLQVYNKGNKPLAVYLEEQNGNKERINIQSKKY